MPCSKWEKKRLCENNEMTVESEYKNYGPDNEIMESNYVIVKVAGKTCCTSKIQLGSTTFVMILLLSHEE